jgi:hypothetical protein
MCQDECMFKLLGMKFALEFATMRREQFREVRMDL